MTYCIDVLVTTLWSYLECFSACNNRYLWNSEYMALLLYFEFNVESSVRMEFALVFFYFFLLNPFVIVRSFISFVCSFRPRPCATVHVCVWKSERVCEQELELLSSVSVYIVSYRVLLLLSFLIRQYIYENIHINRVSLSLCLHSRYFVVVVVVVPAVCILAIICCCSCVCTTYLTSTLPISISVVLFFWCISASFLTRFNSTIEFYRYY